MNVFDAFRVQKERGVNTEYNMAMACNNYVAVYDNWRSFDKLTDTNCLNDKHGYTFAELMTLYIGFPKDLDKFMKSTLKEYCKGNKQAYFEMILSCMTMANVFHEWGYDDVGKVCSEWYHKLFYNKSTYTKYITEDELSDLWRLR